jgi:mannose-6-phosphate isomerase-like protein (cupin superfamily)
MAKHNLFETPRFFADVYVLAPGQAQPPHAHAAEDKCYFVLEGEALVTTGDQRLRAGPGALVHCPAGESHGVENPGPARLRLLVFMAPHPRAAAGGLG